MGIAKLLGLVPNVKEPVDAIGNAFDKLFTSDEERLTKKEAIERLRQKPTLLTHALDKMNAQSSKWFVAAARPFCVWVSGVNIVQLGTAVVWFEKDVPQWYATMSATAFLGALGLYGLARTVEKVKLRRSS